MAWNSSIEWTGSTWNPVTGCTKISSGCRNCYAERMARRLQAMGQVNYKNGFEVAMHDHMLDLPLRRRKPQTIFVNSMSDLFHKSIPIHFINRIIEVMCCAHWHTFQVLTKRTRRLSTLDKHIIWPPNVWLGVTVEHPDYSFRIEHLRSTSASVKFLSIEPLLGPFKDLDLTGIGWVVLGGESGPGARAMDESWVIGIRDLCTEQNVPFFFKQWGGFNKKQNGRLLKGRTWDELPKKRLIREEIVVA